MPRFAAGKGGLAEGGGSPKFTGPDPHPPENRPHLYPAYTQVQKTCSL